MQGQYRRAHLVPQTGAGPGEGLPGSLAMAGTASPLGPLAMLVNFNPTSEAAHLSSSTENS